MEVQHEINLKVEESPDQFVEAPDSSLVKSGQDNSTNLLHTIFAASPESLLDHDSHFPGDLTCWADGFDWNHCCNPIFF